MGIDPEVVRTLAALARTCRDCGKVHEYRSWGPRQGGTWADPEDNHAYRPNSRESASWLESLLRGGPERS